MSIQGMTKNQRLWPAWGHPSYHLLSGIRKTLTRQLPPLLESLVDGATVLDIGCGPKPYEHLFRPPDKELQYLGADIDPDVRPDFLLRESAPWPIADQAADAVVHFFVMEHVRDQRFFLSEIRRILKPGGWLIFGTHGMFVYHPCPHDYYRWTHEGLQAAMEGWSNISVIPVDDDYSGVAVNLNQLLNTIPIAGRPLVRMSNLAVTIARKIRPLDKTLMPSGYLVIAKKS